MDAFDKIIGYSSIKKELNRTERSAALRGTGRREVFDGKRRYKRKRAQGILLPQGFAKR